MSKKPTLIKHSPPPLQGDYKKEFLLPQILQVVNLEKVPGVACAGSNQTEMENHIHTVLSTCTVMSSKKEGFIP